MIGIQQQPQQLTIRSRPATYHTTKKKERIYTLSFLQYTILKAMCYGRTLSNCYETEGAARRAKDGMDNGMVEERRDLQDIPWACLRTMLRADLITERRREQVACPTDQGLESTSWEHWYIVYQLTEKGMMTLEHHEDKAEKRKNEQKQEQENTTLCLTTQ